MRLVLVEVGRGGERISLADARLLKDVLVEPETQDRHAVEGAAETPEGRLVTVDDHDVVALHRKHRCEL